MGDQVEKQITVARLARARRAVGKLEAVLGGSSDTILTDIANELEEAIMDVCGVPEREGKCRDAWALDLVGFFQREPDRGDDVQRVITLLDRVTRAWKEQPPDLHLV